MISVYLGPAHTHAIELNGSANCICIAYFICVVNPETHLPVWGTLWSMEKTYQTVGGVDLVHYRRLGNQTYKIITPGTQRAFAHQILNFNK